MNKKRILIVEDDLDISRTLELYLESEGFQVLISHEGREGLQKAKQEKPDLIVLDLMLPGLPGEELCRDLRKNELNMPIIMVTAKGTDTDKVIGRVIGADCYIAKPFEFDKLIAEITRLI